MIRTTFISLAMLALACAEGAAGSGATSDFQPTGGITVASGNGARFNANRVQGPKVQFSQRSDGSWGGNIYGSAGRPVPIDATFQGGQFVGANIRLTINREGGQTNIFGTVGDRIVRFEVGPTEIRVYTSSTTGTGRSETYVKLAGPGEYGGPQSLKLEGEAQQAPPTPAFALAMVGAFI
ncbi:MAG TPA: hypothetical protein VMT11_14335 [Myxococcaceae bacterium]|nr:hypothetical protein [Myxococcaceae bacterium]